MTEALQTGLPLTVGSNDGLGVSVPERARPRLADGRFVQLACQDCGCGTLRLDRDGWRCDGLIDIGADCELDACGRAVIDGVLYPDARSKTPNV